MIKKLHNAIIFVLNVLIRGYAYLISPLLGAKCRFYPTCSCYMRDALTQHGLVRGMTLGILRLLRCHPWYRGDMFDPVPAKIDWRASLRYKRRDTIKGGPCLCADPDDHRKERP